MVTAKAVTNEMGNTIANSGVGSLKAVSYRDLINTSEVDVKSVIEQVHRSRNATAKALLEHLAYHLDKNGTINIMAAALLIRLGKEREPTCRYGHYFKHKGNWYLYTDDPWEQNWVVIGQGNDYRIIKRTEDMMNPESVRDK